MSVATPAVDDMPGGLLAGLYFDLPFSLYLADSALGSSAIGLLRKNARRYWLSSPLNPDEASRARYRKESRALNVGTAMHAITLEGREAFERAYVRRKDDPPGASPTDKAAATKLAKKRLMQGQWLLHGPEYDLCLETADLIEGHPDLVGSLAGGYHEVSVFWRRPDGIRCKARYDILKPAGMGDLKSIENEFDLPLETAAHLMIKRRRLDIQVEHYLEGRRALRDLVRYPNGVPQVFSCNFDGYPEPSHSSTLVKAPMHLQFARACADASDFGFLLVFIQKSFPGVWATLFSPGNPKLVHARAQIEEAFGIYKANMEKYGPHHPWEDAWRLAEFSWEESAGGMSEFGWQ